METTAYKEKWFEFMREVGKDTALDALNIEIVDVNDESIELVMPISDMVRQPLGELHGGISMVLAESAASIHATWGIDTNEIIPVGIEINGSHVRSAKDGKVRAVGKVIRRSRSLIVHQVDIIHEESSKLLSSIRVTNYYKRLKI